MPTTGMLMSDERAGLVHERLIFWNQRRDIVAFDACDFEVL